jgi:amino acid adenylation domain-containing protein
MASHLAAYLEASAARYPNRTAVVDPDGQSLSYADLNRQADALASFLVSRSVSRGDRVGIVLPKGLPAVVAIFGVLKTGAAYVPVDWSAPADRGRRILTDCDIRALIVDAGCLDVAPPGDIASQLATIVVVGAIPEDVAGTRDATPWDRAIHPPDPGDPAGLKPRLHGDPSDLAYILYTSGSTGMPKGAMITHGNALSFIDWCSAAFFPSAEDRFSNHAPFHFDASVVDIYLSIKHGASVYLISDDLGRSPKELARFVAEKRLTVWFSTPWILSLLVQFGQLGAHDASALRLVLFGGEVFPVKHLRELKRYWRSAVYYNLYGPTEITVACTSARIPDDVPGDREAPYPIGFPCTHCRALVLDADGREVGAGGEGVLHISGPSVFAGYWNRPLETAAVFLDRDGVRWYNTGDVVRFDPAEGFTYVGRQDRMVKRRGYRIELGEIESALYAHPRLREAAVVSMPDADAGVKLIAFVSPHDAPPPSIVELKTFCATKVPAYMSPDRFVFRDRLPRTSSDKIDYQALLGALQTEGT